MRTYIPSVVRTLLSMSIISLTGCFAPSHLTVVKEELYQSKEYHYLSPTNEALATSIVFNDLLHTAPELSQHVQNKGYPSALRIEALTPLRISLAYKDTRQYYTAKLLSSGWIITGPKALPKKLTLPETATGESFIATPSPTKQLSPTKVSTEPLHHDPSVTVVHSYNKEAFTNKIKNLVTTLAGEPAKKNGQGDIIHEISGQQESLEALALWYTYDPSTTMTIARINNMKSSLTKAGQTLTIPSYLVNNPSKYHPDFERLYKNH